MLQKFFYGGHGFNMTFMVTVVVISIIVTISLEIFPLGPHYEDVYDPKDPNLTIIIRPGSQIEPYKKYEPLIGV